MCMAEQKIEEFLCELSSKAPVPGGGGASAMAAAAGMALGSMVANLTIGKKKYAQYQEELEELLKKGETLRSELLAFMDKDAEAFEPLAKAYALPKNTEQELAKRNEIMEKALLAASLTPLALMEKILTAMQLLNRLSVIGSKLAISDVGVGIKLLLAALEGASFNVFINTDLMKDTDKATKLNQKADVLLEEGRKLEESTFAAVIGKIR